MTMCVVCGGGSLRQACDACLSAVRRRLRELELYFEWLASPSLLAPVRGGVGRRSPGYGSRPPARVDAIVLTDSRSRVEPPEVDEDRGVGLDGDDQSLPILDTLHTLATWIREARQHPAPRRVALSGEVGYLLGQLDWAASEPGVADLAATIRRLHSQARAVAGDRPPAPLGICLTLDCGGLVYPPPPRRDTARCSRCDRGYTGLALVRLAVAQKAAG